MKHVIGSFVFAPENIGSTCPYYGKHWGFHEKKQQAESAVLSDESSWQPVDQATLAFVQHRIEIEYDKHRREKRKGYMAEA